MAGNTLKLKKCIVKNFGSYKDLTFDFSNKGLTLVYGPTGSGKSTLPDIPAWILYGVTSKGYKAEEVKNWSSLQDITSGELEVDTPLGIITVTRIRGKPNQNDLYWKETNSNDLSRGKDLLDTQRLLNARLGVNSDLYVSGSYYHEFCPTGAFFLASTSDKRELFEKVVDLSLPLNLLEKAKELEKIATKEYQVLLQDEKSFQSDIARYKEELVTTETANKNWIYNKNNKIKELEYRFDRFQDSRLVQLLEIKDKISHISIYNVEAVNDQLKILNAEIKSLKSQKCSECGGSKHSEEIYKKLEIIKTVQIEVEKQRSLINELKHLNDQYTRIENQPNPYTAVIDEVKCSTNILQDRLIDLEDKLKCATESLELIKEDLNTKYNYMTALCKIATLSYDLRGHMLTSVTKQIENSTNDYLEKYFDSELKVSFTLEDSDKLTVNIQKNGYECVYKQLSKGQRALLRLSFVISVMKAVSNNHGVHFDNLFMDEALDGLDENLKSKAFQLFEQLSTGHSSILVIDHSESFKELFNSKYCVTIESDISTIKEINE